MFESSAVPGSADVTVIIPSYNHAGYILECLSAAIRIRNSSVIIIDDGSTDDTIRQVQMFKERCPEYAVEVLSKKNAGLVDSLNKGLALAKTEFFYLVASDDVPVPEGIAEIIDSLKRNPSAQFCIGGGVTFWDDAALPESPVYGKSHDRFFNLPMDVRNQQALLNYPAPVLLQSTVFRTDALKSIEGWDTAIVLDDYPVFVKLLRKFPLKDVDFLFDPGVVTVKYRQHVNNSFRDISRQFGIVKGALEALSPPELKNRAVGKALAYYSLFAIKMRRWQVLSTICQHVGTKAKIYALLYIFPVLLQRISRR